MAGLKAARHQVADKIRTTLPQAIIDAGVDVLAHDPAEYAGAVVTVSTARVLPSDWGITVRIYVPANQGDAEADLLDDITEMVDLALSGYEGPRTIWAWTFDDIKGQYYMQTQLMLAREDM